MSEFLCYLYGGEAMLGRRIGAYEVVSQIGEGGMGVVYMARHSTLGRLAAVKVLLPELSNNREIVARFFNEARAATAIRHPGIIEVYDFGFLDEQLAYIIMEYLEGESLGARLRRGPLAMTAVLATTRGIARALQAAHEKGIVHRDLKPDNVFLVPDEDSKTGQRIKLLDFGIAKLAFNAQESGRTRTGTIVGTPTYMAPEQCRGTGAIDLRADLYALGCVMYELLSGRPPFIADASADVLAHHLYFEPKRISALRPEVPPAIEQLVMSLLAKDPANRPASAGDVVKVLDSYAAGASDSHVPVGHGVGPVHPGSGPSQAMPTTLSGAAVAMDGSRRPGHRRALMIGLASLAVALVVVVGVIAAERASSEPDEAAWPTETHSTATASAGSSAASTGEISPAVTPAPEPVPKPAPQPVPKPGLEPVPKPAPEPASKPVSAPASSPVPKPASSAEVIADGAPGEARISGSGRSSPESQTQPRPPKPISRQSQAVSEDSEKKRPTPDCTRASFQRLLEAQAPSKDELGAALHRLRKCEETLGNDAFPGIRDQLVNKRIGR